MYKLPTYTMKIKAAREGASVVRTHTFQTTSQHYTNGYHTFNMLTMLRILNPQCRRELIWAVLEHDIPEKLIGDTPAPAKWYGLTNQEAVHKTERSINEEIFGVYSNDELLPSERGWLSGLDILEFYLWMRDECALGNDSLRRMFNRVDHVFKSRASVFPTEILNVYYEAKGTDWDLLPDLGEEL